jgi:hypothetical protein
MVKGKLYAVIVRSAATKQSLTENALIVKDCFGLIVMYNGRKAGIPVLAMMALDDALLVTTNTEEGLLCLAMMLAGLFSVFSEVKIFFRI